MLALAFETSTRAPSVALSSGGELQEERLSGERPHASDLLPALDRLLTRTGRRARELDLIVVGTGPGSFTGLRVAVATALGLSRGNGASLFGVPSGEALCWRELAPGEQGAVALDARGGDVYFARYGRRAGGIEVLRAACLLRGEELEAALAEVGRVFADPGAAAWIRDGELRARVEEGPVPSAAALLELGLARFAREGGHAPAALEPLYLRAFGARAKPS